MNKLLGAWIAGMLTIGLWLPGVFLSVSLADIGRDPFQAVSASSCTNEREKLTGWQLQGIVSGEHYRAGWMQSPDAHWKKLTSGLWLLPKWQVKQISGPQLELQYENPETPCPGLSVTVSLLRP